MHVPSPAGQCAGFTFVIFYFLYRIGNVLRVRMCMKFVSCSKAPQRLGLYLMLVIVVFLSGYSINSIDSTS